MSVFLKAAMGGDDVDRSAERAERFLDRLAVSDITAANSPDGARTEPAGAAVTAGNDLRKRMAAASGQIIREGDAPRETGRFGGVASCPDTEFQAKASEDNGATVPGPAVESPADCMAGEVSRVDAGRTASATSERMDATAGRDRHLISESLVTAPRPAKQPEAGNNPSPVSGAYSPWRAHRPHLEPLARRAS